jgi:hypothetical protein
VGATGRLLDFALSVVASRGLKDQIDNGHDVLCGGGTKLCDLTSSRAATPGIYRASRGGCSSSIEHTRTRATSLPSPRRGAGVVVQQIVDVACRRALLALDHYLVERSAASHRVSTKKARGT